ncbi:non-canonical purine NTP pyrophosphatase [Candidatus Woesearchaeota archaeon]|nr:non-canonical purine NTP pyrophosphatase [Candidatus Woesearchaeota archaeon]
MTLYYATTNKNKFREARQILGIAIKQASIALDELQGSGTLIVEHKARQAYLKLRQPVFVEDVEFYIEGLNGLPGPYIKHFLAALQPAGLYALASPTRKLNARAVSRVGYCSSGNKVRIFTGQVSGRIVKPAGRHGFGFDHIFVPEGSSKTWAQLRPEDKNAISHRARSLARLRHFLRMNKSFK